MQGFIHTMRLARKDFFKLKKHRDVPEWSLWLITFVVSLQWGVGMLAVGGFLSGRWRSMGWWTEQAPPFVFSAFVIGATLHVAYTLIERLAPQRFIDWTNGEPGVLVSVFFGVSSMACIALGSALAYLLMGGLPGMERVDWTPHRGWLPLAVGGIFFSILWGLWAWQNWHEEQLKRQAKEAELRLLQAQIEPHFLFNTLANVRSLIDCDPPQAGELLDAFTDHLRASLTSMRAELVPLDTELALVGHYLRMMQMRMGERLQFTVDADAAARAVMLPPLLLQPLVENAIHHGLECQVEPGHVHLQARVVAGQLRLSVQDDGVGLDAPRPRKGNGVATHNIRDRLQSRYGASAGLTIEPAQPKGTRATIYLPLTP